MKIQILQNLHVFCFILEIYICHARTSSEFEEKTTISPFFYLQQIRKTLKRLQKNKPLRKISKLKSVILELQIDVI